MRKTRKKAPKWFVEDFNALLDDKKIAHEDARLGSALLRQLADDIKFNIFVSICLNHAGPSAVAKESATSGLIAEKNINQFASALRRLSVVAAPLAEKLSNDAKPKQSLPEVELSFNPGLSGLEAHIARGKVAPKDYDCVAKMAGLTTVLEQQFKDLYTYKPREAQPFFEVQKVNMVAQTLMTALEKLHKMQMDVGIVEKSPEKMEVNLNHAGAFQTYVGELSRDHKQTMIDFADKFAKFVREKADTQ